uniref:PHD domain-containing protein n=1 Tax=Globodera pallida TaxID=36090 RepID=A0A183CH51_GLOPA
MKNAYAKFVESEERRMVRWNRASLDARHELKRAVQLRDYQQRVRHHEATTAAVTAAPTQKRAKLLHTNSRILNAFSEMHELLGFDGEQFAGEFSSVPAAQLPFSLTPTFSKTFVRTKTGPAADDNNNAGGDAAQTMSKTVTKSVVNAAAVPPLFSQCQKATDAHRLVYCDTCKCHYHIGCLDPPLVKMPAKSKFSRFECSDCACPSETEKKCPTKRRRPTTGHCCKIAQNVSVARLGAAASLASLDGQKGMSRVRQPALFFLNSSLFRSRTLQCPHFSAGTLQCRHTSVPNTSVPAFFF